MRYFALAFFCGVLSLIFFHHLPSIAWLAGLFLLNLIFYLFFNNIAKRMGPILFGFIWAASIAHFHLSWSLPKALEGKNIFVTGDIASIPEKTDFGSSFIFSLQKCNDVKAHGKLKLIWRDSPPLTVGDQWQLLVRLKRVHGVQNPAGFDFEAWALENGIRAKGYIVPSLQNKCIHSDGYHDPVDRLRQHLKQTIENNLPKTLTSPWIIALVVGERTGIDSANWQVLRNTGTNHLMAIAGLHIGFMSGLIYWIVQWLWRRSTVLPLKIPAQKAASVGALLMAGLYSMLAGFSLPTQRAFCMLFFFLLSSFCQRKIFSWSAWAWALMIVLMMNPLCVMDASFWLSFGSVALIIYGAGGRLAAKGLWWKWGRIQWVISIGLIPLGIAFFQQCSFISFVANSIAIPWVGFLIVPLALLGSFFVCFSAKIGGFFLMAADKCLSLLWVFLTYLSHLTWGNSYLIVPTSLMIISLLGIIFLLAPKGLPGRYVGCIWILPLIFYRPSVPSFGEARLTILDVGQGLASVIQTEKHTLVFDAGPKLGDHVDMGENVVVPYLRALRLRVLDLLVISHGDNDHIGGAHAVLAAFKTKQIATSVPDKIMTPVTHYCLRGQSWEWDGVKFEFLYPTLAELGLGNDSSCVLRVIAGGKTILLTGDIEKRAENYLVDHDDKKLKADILIAPHHGSKTSAEKSFINAVLPKIVIFAIGYCNRYHFPHPSVVEKYEANHALHFDTSASGAIQFFISQNEMMMSLYRKEHERYWF